MTTELCCNQNILYLFLDQLPQASFLLTLGFTFAPWIKYDSRIV